jgi:hypothetical protein
MLVLGSLYLIYYRRAKRYQVFEGASAMKLTNGSQMLSHMELDHYVKGVSEILSRAQSATLQDYNSEFLSSKQVK